MAVGILPRSTLWWNLPASRSLPGTLQPAFSGGIIQYRVDVTTDIESVTITAQPAVAGDTVTINGQATTSRVITLDDAGTTTPVSIVVSESGTNSRTYTVLLVRSGLTGRCYDRHRERGRCVPAKGGGRERSLSPSPTAILTTPWPWRRRCMRPGGKASMDQISKPLGHDTVRSGAFRTKTTTAQIFGASAAH